MPAVSVIVPNYNHAKFLRKRIDSILAQTYQDFELILLDDASTDDSRPILREYASDPRARLEFNEVNSGSSFKQWNKGVGLARGKYVWIAESDDYAEPHLLERLVAALDADPEVKFAYCRSRRVSADDRFDGYSDYYLVRLHSSQWLSDFCMDGREMCEKYFSRTNPVANSSAVVFRKAVYEGVGGADGTLRICGDWKLWAAMALQGKVAYLSEPLNCFRFHEASVRSQTIRARADIPEHLRVTRWVLDRVPVPRDLLEKIREDKAALWLPAVCSRELPREAKAEILRLAKAVDPHPLRSAAEFVPTWIRLRILSRMWYAMLDLTYAPRHALHLTRDGLARSKVRLRPKTR